MLNSCRKNRARVPRGFPKAIPRGIALMQVLLMTAIISILLLIMMAYTKQHLEQADELEIRLQQHFDLYSAMADLQTSLLAHHWLSPGDSGYEATDDGWQRNWNFWGEPFQVGDFNARITTLTALTDLRGVDTEMAELLVHVGVPAQRARGMARELMLFQRPDEQMSVVTPPSPSQPHIPVQHITELEQLSQWTREDALRIEPFVTTFASRLLNWMYLPDRLLELKMSSAEAEVVRAARADNTFNRRLFTQLTGYDQDEFVLFYPGPDFRIEIWHNSADSIAVLEFEGTFDPHSSVPVQKR